jgi:hypothetical protein
MRGLHNGQLLPSTIFLVSRSATSQHPDARHGDAVTRLPREEICLRIARSGELPWEAVCEKLQEKYKTQSMGSKIQKTGVRFSSMASS